MTDHHGEPIEYRNPKTPGAGADPIHLRMIQKHALTTAGALGLIGAGAAILLVAGAVVASLVCFVLIMLTESSWIGWWGWYLAFLLLMVPLLFWEEQRSGGDYLEDRARDFAPARSSRGEFELQNAQIGIAAYTDMLLWGPRAILRGIATLRGENPLDRSRRFARAAQLVRQLLQSEGGVPVTSLTAPGEDAAELQRTLGWLDDHDYVGISADRKRVWLSTTAREALRDLG